MSGTDGHGTIITFGTSGFAARLIDDSGPGLERDPIESTTMATTDAKEFIPASLYDGGSLDLTFEFSGDDNPPIDQPEEAITINWAGSGNIWSFDGFMTGYSPGASIGERMTASASVKVNGKITVT